MQLKQCYLFILPLLFSAVVSAQTLTFCDYVSSEGECSGEETAFYSDSASIDVKVKITMTEAVNTNRVDLKIYKMVDSVETYDATIPIDVQTDWGWFYRGVVFYEDAQYKIYAYKADGTYLCSGTIDIYLWWDDEWWDY